MSPETAGGDRRVEAYRLLMADVYELAGLSRATSEAIADGTTGQTVAQWHVMSVLSEAWLPVPAIARRLGLKRQSVQRVVDNLAASGHVEFRPNPGHQRSDLVGLTERGRGCLHELNAAAELKRAAQLAEVDVTVAQLMAARATIQTLIVALSA